MNNEKKDKFDFLENNDVTQIVDYQSEGSEFWI